MSAPVASPWPASCPQKLKEEREMSGRSGELSEDDEWGWVKKYQRGQLMKKKVIRKKEALQRYRDKIGQKREVKVAKEAKEAMERQEWQDNESKDLSWASPGVWDV